MNTLSFLRLPIWSGPVLATALLAGCGGGSGASSTALDSPAVLALLQAADGELVPRGSARSTADFLGGVALTAATAAAATDGVTPCPGGGTLTKTTTGVVSEHVFDNCVYVSMDPPVVDYRIHGSLRLTELTGAYDENQRLEADLEFRINYGGGGFEAFAYDMDATLREGPGIRNGRAEIPSATIRHYGSPPPHPVAFDLTIALSDVDWLVMPGADFVFRYGGTFAASGTDRDGQVVDVSATFSTIEDLSYLDPVGSAPNFPYSGVSQIQSADGLSVRIRFGVGELFVQVNDEPERRLSHAEFLALTGDGS